MTQIDDKEYDLETKRKTNSVCRSRMNAKTARIAYAEALKQELPKA